MATVNNAPAVAENIKKIYERRVVAVFALAGNNALQALLRFKRAQSQNTFWKNETSDALNRMSTKPFKRGTLIGFRMTHGIFYGIWLELANEGRHAAIRPIIGIQAKIFFKEAKALYSD